ncbi:hypothetical protein T265_09808 [Opisthorchis viverrini]|uniref:Uncharacterized protein n=1 Tax=Opisthorchis viverrini TaxID=6198 RepID=A0A074Z4J7_OPIVI|nr:hypothetical protein T265_09808 [Opisthorchis viverrini]KER22016.1 hypothetical protein T265_09808 [Opisthorchis viverrini]
MTEVPAAQPDTRFLITWGGGEMAQVVRARIYRPEAPWLGQPGSIPALVLPSGGMTTRHQKGATAEQNGCNALSVHSCQAIRRNHEGRFVVRLPKPGQEHSRCRCRVRTTDLPGALSSAYSISVSERPESIVKLEALEVGKEDLSSKSTNKLNKRNKGLLRLPPLDEANLGQKLPSVSGLLIGGLGREICIGINGLDARSPLRARLGHNPSGAKLPRHPKEAQEQAYRQVAQVLNDVVNSGKMDQGSERGFTDQKFHGSNGTSASRHPLSKLQKPDSIPALVLPSGGMTVTHRKGTTSPSSSTA